MYNGLNQMFGYVDQRGQINKFMWNDIRRSLEKINNYELCGYRLKKWAEVIQYQIL